MAEVFHKLKTRIVGNRNKSKELSEANKHSVVNLDTRSKWDSSAQSYFEAEDITNEEVNFPALIRTLGDMTGKIVLDFGCGNGRFSSQIAQLGAANVIGVDISPEMIQLARKENTRDQTKYHVNPDNSLSFLASNSIDIAVANLVFMMSPSKKELATAMKEIYRVLKPGGTFVYLVTHSAFIERGAHDYRNEFDGPFDYTAEEKPYRFILQKVDGTEIDEDFYDYHYTLSTYLNTAMDSGFCLQHVEELSYPSEVVRQHDVPQEFTMFPQAIIIKAKK